MPLINCEINLILTWSENCVLTSKATRDAELYVPVVTLSTENNKILLEQLRTGSKRTIKWNKYRSEMTNQSKK